MNRDWMTPDLPCRRDPELFHPADGDQRAARRAKAICDGCRARNTCLEYALATDQQDGIWAGLNVRQRRALKQANLTRPLLPTEIRRRERRQQAHQLRDAGLTPRQIAEDMGLTRETIRDYLQDAV